MHRKYKYVFVHEYICLINGGIVLYMGCLTATSKSFVLTFKYSLPYFVSNTSMWTQTAG